MKGSQNKLLVAVGVPVLIGMAGIAMGAAMEARWSKSDVIPVVLVKPGIGGFEPVEGSLIGNVWTKSEVKAIVLVRPGIGGFEPREGISIGNTWTKQEVLPVILVESSGRAFVSLEMLDRAPAAHPIKKSPKGSELAPIASGGSVPSVIETQIDGDKDGTETRS